MRDIKIGDTVKCWDTKNMYFGRDVVVTSKTDFAHCVVYMARYHTPTRDVSFAMVEKR